MILRSSIWFVILVLLQFTNGDLTKDRLQKSVSIFNVIKVITKLFTTGSNTILIYIIAFFQFPNNPCPASDMKVSFKHLNFQQFMHS